nr:tetratricopeptide repeat protein [Paucisalibacillus globulus]
MYIHDEIGNFEEVVSFSDQIIALDPSQIDAYYYKGSVLVDLDKVEEAINVYDTMIEKFPESPYGYYGKSLTLMYMEQKEEALKLLAKTIEIDPSYKDWAYEDPMFHNLIEDDEFLEIIGY